MIQTCTKCRRVRRAVGVDAKDYSPVQVILGQPLGWYSNADEGDLCPECMTSLIRDQ